MTVSTIMSFLKALTRLGKRECPRCHVWFRPYQKDNSYLSPNLCQNCERTLRWRALEEGITNALTRLGKRVLRKE